MRSEDRVLAIACSDIHLSLKPPIARAQEPSWLDAQARAAQQLYNLTLEHNTNIVLCAGDIFDKWNSPVELVNWALDNMPFMFAIPGNHDLPSHRHDLAHRSAYGSLMRAGKLKELSSESYRPSRRVKGHVITGDLHLYGFPFGTDPTPPKKKRKGEIHVALVHEYLWVDGCGYTGATEEAKLVGVRDKFAGFDVVVVGDNHMSFIVSDENTTVINTGTLMRRKSNEVSYQPSVGLIWASGKVTTHQLDISDDIITELQADEAGVLDQEVVEFIHELARLEASNLNFRDTMTRALDHNKVSDLVREVILEALE